MKQIKRILGLTSPQDPKETHSRISENILRIAQWLHADLDTSSAATAQDLKDAIESRHPDLLVTGPQLGESIFRNVPLTEKSPPLLILPPRLDLDAQPIDSLTVALSGEKRRNDALSLALRIANQTHSPVDLLHVTEPSAICCCEACSMEKFPDQFQHEYPQMVEKIVAEGSPFSTLEERRHVRSLCHCAGQPGSELTDYGKTHPKSALVLEWKGEIGPGRAEILKEVIENSQIPVFVVIADSKPGFRLKVGGDFKAA